MHSGHHDLVTLLYRRVTHIDGRHFNVYCQILLINNLWPLAGWKTQHDIQVIYLLLCLTFCIKVIFMYLYIDYFSCHGLWIPLVVHASISNFLCNVWLFGIYSVTGWMWVKGVHRMVATYVMPKYHLNWQWILHKWHICILVKNQ